jgi:hypothetical protein
MVHACNLNTWEAEVGGWQVQSQPVLHSNTVTKKQQNNNNKAQM